MQLDSVGLPVSIYLIVVALRGLPVGCLDCTTVLLKTSKRLCSTRVAGFDIERRCAFPVQEMQFCWPFMVASA
ncbi:MAG TPA: hypothetical protein DDW73_13310 [Rhizobium sp.]|nr:hypothetical protein [Rhizobium sp.]